MTDHSFKNLIRELPQVILVIQESITNQIRRIVQKELTDLDGKEYKKETHESLTRLFPQLKQDISYPSEKKIERQIVFRASLNYLSKQILSKYLCDENKASDFQLNLPKTDFDYLNPSQKTKTTLLEYLERYNFEKLSYYQLGAIYQEILKLCNQQHSLGAFYTPKDTVKYMVSKLNLSTNSTVFDPACGDGNFLEGCFIEIKKKLMKAGYTELKANKEAISQIWGNDIDPYAVLISIIRMFSLSANKQVIHKSNLVNYDTLELKSWSHFTSGKKIDCIICNPPYGIPPSMERKKLYKRIYRNQTSVYGYKLSGNDLYGFFLAGAIKNVKNSGIICFIISDTFLSLKSHTILRRLILDTCKINEIVLAPIDLFRPMTISRTCIITLTKQLCEKGYSHKKIKSNQQIKSHCECKACRDRRNNRIKLVDRLKNQSDYFNPLQNSVQIINQGEYEGINGNAFWVNVNLNFVQIMRFTNPMKPPNTTNGWKYEELRQHMSGGEGISTGDNYSHLAIVKDSALWEELNRQRSIKLEKYKVLSANKIVDLSSVDEETLERYRYHGIEGDKFLVPFERGSYFPYWGTEGWFIDWGADSVERIKRRARESRGRRAVFRNPHLYFMRGITTNAHHGVIKATLVEYSIVAGNSNLLFGTTLETEFILGFLNSKLASYFLGKIINTSLGGMSGHATPEDFKRLPVRFPTTEENIDFFEKLKNQVIDKVNEIIKLLQTNPKAEFSIEQEEIDELIFEWFGLNETEKNDVNNYLDQSMEEKERY
ncbi:MAG: class I SAM-dependent DNA methyltransferase [Candidatus Hodarchaeota archaeon]